MAIIVNEYTLCKDFKVNKVDEILFVKHAQMFKHFSSMKEELRHQFLEMAKFGRFEKRLEVTSAADVEEDLTFLLVNGEVSIYEEQSYIEHKKPKTRLKLFQVIKAGAMLPFIQLAKLAKLNECKIITVCESGPVDVLKFKNSEVSAHFFGPLKRSLLSKIEAQSQLDIFFQPIIKEGEPQNPDDDASPYIMMVLAIVC